MTWQKGEKKRGLLNVRVLVCSICMMLLLLQLPAFADSYVGGMPLETVQSGVVSGDLFVDADMTSWDQMDVTKQFSLPAYIQIRWARLYVVVYCGHMQNNYNGTATVSFDGNGDGAYETTLGTENLDVPFTNMIDGGPGYALVNSYTSRVSSDYLMWYDVGSKITSQNPRARVVTARTNPSFDGRIKAITLVVAYDDGDTDQVWYSVNQGQDTDTYYSDDQLGEDYRGETSFDPSGLSGSVERATLTVNHLASQDGFYRFNGEELNGGQHQGAYFGYNTWDVTGEVRDDDSNLLTYDRYGGTGSGSAGQFYKIILATLTIRQGNESGETEPEQTSAGSGGESSGSDSSDSVDIPADENGYYGQTIPAVISGSVNGSVNICQTSDYSGLIGAGESKNYTLQVPLSTGEQARFARLYVYTTWGHDEKRREGLAAPLTLQFGNLTFSPAAHYSDRKGFGIYDYPVETFAFDVHDSIREPGNYSFTIQNSGKGGEAFSVYGAVLVLASESESGIPTQYWISEGSDILLADPAFDTTTEDSTTFFPFENITAPISSGRLYLISTGASGEPGDENRVTFNGAEWSNQLANGSSAVSIAKLDVTDSVRPGRNEASVQSYITMKKGDYLENRGAVLVVVSGGLTGPASTQTTGQKPAQVPRPVHTEMPTPGAAPGNGEQPPGFFDWIIQLVFAPILPTFAQPDGSGSSSSTLSSEVNLTIFTDPDGARVTINGVDLEDLTPLLVPVSRGASQRVTVTLDGYDAYQTTVSPASDYDLHIIFIPYVPPLSAGSSTSSSGNGHIGGIFVDSYPSGATVIIDGRKTEQITPHVIYGLREGYHTVGVEKKNTMFPASRRAYVAAGAITPVTFTEGVVYARTLNITSEDFQGSPFTVNGRGPPLEIPGGADIAGTPAYLVIFHDGSYLYRNVLPNLESGDTMLIRSNQQDRELLSVVITSDPSGSEILFDGFPTGFLTPAVVGNVSPGLHRITVQAPGFLPAEKELSIIDAMNDPIDAKVFIHLEEYPHGSLNLTSSPPGAKIYLSGRNTGEKTPVIIPYLPIGMYNVKLVGGEESRTYEVVVTPGEEKSVHAVFPE
jgi:hypothetical protein